MYYEKYLAIILKKLGFNHPDVATSYNNLGGVYYSKGNYDRAIEYYEKSLVIRLEKLDSNHPDLATSYNNLGGAYYFKKQYEKSLEYFKEALSIGKQNLAIITQIPKTL